MGNKDKLKKYVKDVVQIVCGEIATSSLKPILHIMLGLYPSKIFVAKDAVQSSLTVIWHCTHFLKREWQTSDLKYVLS